MPTATQQDQAREPAPLYSDMSDEELMGLVADGDERAYDEIFDRYHQQIYNFIRKSVHDDQPAHDITQEVFMRVFRSASSFDTSRKFTSWLYTIAVNEVKRYFKKKKRRTSLSLNDPVGDTEDGSERGDFMESEETEPDELAADLATSRQLEKVIDKLPEKQKQVVLLKAYQGLTFDEISRIIDTPLSTVLSRMRYAVKKLKRYLGVEEED